MTAILPPRPDPAVLDRHALAVSIWVSAGLVAAALAHYGLGAGGPAALGCAFGAILLAFVGHLLVNLVTGLGFTARELALGLVLYLLALAAFGLGVLVDPAPWEGRTAVAAGGFVLLPAAVLFYLVTARGVRGAFEAFDVVRSFRAVSGRRGEGRR